MSLRDQLLKKGIASKKQFQKVRSEKKSKNKQQSKNQLEHNQSQKNELNKQRNIQIERDRQLNKKAEQEKMRHAEISQIKQIIESNKLDHENGNNVYNFIHNNKVKKLYFSDLQHKKIISGIFCIINFEEDKYYIIPAVTAKKISEINKNYIVVNNQKNKNCNEKSESSDKDFYSQYEIPDDIMW